MNVTAVTFVDEKMLHLAQEQAENCKSFGIKHVIYRIDDVKYYSTQLWMDLITLTMDAVHKHGKIMRLDAEVRIHRPLPQDWLENDNVFFRAHPLVKHPWFIAMNTGQMIIGETGLRFLNVLRECIAAMIPPDGDTSLPISGDSNHIDDEYPSAIAIRLSEVKFKQELLKFDRRDATVARANRGTWLEKETILTHPTIHTWNMHGGGIKLSFDTINETDFINHYPGQLREAEFIADLMIKNEDAKIWNKFSKEIDLGIYETNGYIFQPKAGLYAPKEHWPMLPKKLKRYN